MRNAPKHLQLSFQHAEVASDLERQQETITNSCSCFQVTIAILLQPFAELLMSSNWHRYWPVSGHTLKTVDTSTSLWNVIDTALAHPSEEILHLLGQVMKVIILSLFLYWFISHWISSQQHSKVDILCLHKDQRQLQLSPLHSLFSVWQV